MDSSKNTSVTTQEMTEFARQLDLANVNEGDVGALAPLQQPAEPAITTVKRRFASS